MYEANFCQDCKAIVKVFEEGFSAEICMQKGEESVVVGEIRGSVEGGSLSLEFWAVHEKERRRVVTSRVAGKL